MASTGTGSGSGSGILQLISAVLCGRELDGLKMVELKTIGLVPGTRRGRAVGLMLLLVALIIWSCIHRLHTDRHYGRMFVRLDEKLAENDTVTVFTRGSDGVVTPLIRRDEDPRLFSRDSGWKKVTSIVITGDSIGPVRPDQVDVRVGAGWPHTTVLPVRGVQVLSVDSTGLEAQRRRLQFEQACEVFVDEAKQSVFSRNEGVINWQGDMLLVFHALTQGMLFTILLVGTANLLYRLGQLAGSGVVVRGGVIRLMAEVIRFFMLVLSVHLAWLWFWQLYVMREAAWFVPGILAAIGLAALFACWCRIVERTGTERQLAIRMLMLTILAAILKLYWLSHSEGTPRSDYARYYEYGKQLAAGDWEKIRNSPRSQSAIYLRRALVCTYPVAAVFGSSLSVFGAVYTGVQSLTAIMFSLLVWRMAGIRASAYALPLLLISPEIWYHAGMITHNVFGYFWIVATWLAFACWLRQGALQQQRGTKWPVRMLWALCWGIALGIGLSMVELTKGYGIMVEASLATTIVCGPTIMRSLGGRIAEALQFLPGRYALLIMAVVTYRTLVPGVDAFLLSRSGLELPRQWLLAIVSSVESAGPGGGESLAVWLSRYHFQTPGKRVTPLVLRKILHEKLGAAPELLKCLLRKNELLASVVDSLGHSQDSAAPVAVGPRVENIRFGSLQYTLATAIMLGIGILFIGRLLLPVPSLSWTEFFPMTASGMVMAVIYLAVESHAYYSANLVFPMCWSAGVVLDRLRQPKGSEAAPIRLPILRLLSWNRLVAAVTGIAFLGCYCLLGRAMDRSGLTFFPISISDAGSVSQLPETAATGKTAAYTASGATRVHGWLEFRTESGQIRKGERIVQRFVVQTGGSKLTGLSFFLSGNQRARIHRINDNWKSLPFQYSVAIENFSVVESRPIEELALPRFWSIPRKLWDKEGKVPPQNVTFTVTLECTEDVAIGRLSPPPAVAIEYLH